MEIRNGKRKYYKNSQPVYKTNLNFILSSRVFYLFNHLQGQKIECKDWITLCSVCNIRKKKVEMELAINTRVLFVELYFFLHRKRTKNYLHSLLPFILLLGKCSNV